jgi:hypothetical protein
MAARQKNILSTLVLNSVLTSGTILLTAALRKMEDTPRRADQLATITREKRVFNLAMLA